MIICQLDYIDIKYCYKYHLKKVYAFIKLFHETIYFNYKVKNKRDIAFIIDFNERNLN